LTSPAHESDRTLAAARTSLSVQRAGGRRLVAERHSIGRTSRQLKNQHFLGRIWRMLLGVIGVVVAAMIAGIAIGGIGFAGLFFTALATIMVAALLLRYPVLKVPSRQQLAQGSLKSIVGNTELWLETQRRALPAPAVQLVDQIGVQLDALGIQLGRIGEEQPAAVEIRKLVGEHLPELVASYTAIPVHLRSEPRGGRTPDEQLAESLGKISGEIDSVTRQLASGSIDDLAIKARYLDYKYGGALAESEPGR
jgi:hypothetical protein